MLECIPALIDIVTLYYQYYINRKGLPLSSDFIVYQRNYGRNKPLMWSYYYQ